MKLKLALIVLSALVLASLPYVLGYLLAPTDMRFSGTVMNVEDSYSYLAKMLQGARGQLLYRIPFTSEEHQGAFVGGFYLFWGWMARWTGLNIVYLWHISRILSGTLFLVTIYFFIAHFILPPGRRLFAFLLSVYGSGLGWVILLTGRRLLLGSLPVDFKMPEAHPFFTLLTFPHFAFAAAMILGTFLLTLRYLESTRIIYSLLAGLCMLLLTIAQPFDLVIVVAVLGTYLALLSARREFTLGRIAGLLPLALIPLPMVIYHLFVFITNPAFRAWWNQAKTPSPHPLHYFLAGGFILLLAIPGAIRAWRERRNSFLLVWAVIALPLLYLPVNPQRRFIEGWQIPLSILATTGVYDFLLPRWESSRLYAWLMHFPRYKPASMRMFVMTVIFLLIIPSNVYILASLAVTALEHPYPYFHETAEVEAMDWLGNNTRAEETVFTTYWTGSYIPARAGNYVFLGHWAETSNVEEKMELARTFFDAQTSDQWRLQFLREYNVSYLFYGPRERPLGFQPEGVPYLNPVFHNDLVSIYRVAR